MMKNESWYAIQDNIEIAGKYSYSMSANEMEQYCFLVEQNLDWNEYVRLNNVEPSDINGIIHYIKNWAAKNLNIPNLFNTHEYLYLNRDSLKLKMNPIEHYFKLGKIESRKTHCNLNKFWRRQKGFRHELETLKLATGIRHNYCQEHLHGYYVLFNSSIDWEKFALENGVSFDREVISTCLFNKDERNFIIDSVFNADEYLRAYPDIKQAKFNPIVHYFSEGLLEGRKGLGSKLDSSLFDVNLAEHYAIECEKLNEFDLDWSAFYEFNNIADNTYSPIQYYVQNWSREALQVPNVFDTKFYLDSYPDIAKIGMNPLLHFLQSGESEGRVGIFVLDDYFVTGGFPHKPDLPNLVVVCHESSPTGAPLVGINVGNELSAKYNVFHVLLREGSLNEAFITNSVGTVFGIADQAKFFVSTLLASLNVRYPLHAAICNSVETINVLDVFSEMKIPTVSLIHEFSEYTRPKGKIGNTVCFADRVIVPAKVISDSICAELVECFAVKVVPNNIVVAPQGHLPFIPSGYGKNLSVEQLRIRLAIEDEDTKVFVAAGYVQIRKGTDLFVDVAQKIKKQYGGKCKFLWVGDGLDIVNDLGYSVWVQKQIDESNLGDDIVFLDHQKNLDNVLAIADVFLMTSRLDPFPNVVIDALAADLHVACFNHSTGCAEFLLDNNANASVSAYLDTNEMAQQIIEYLENESDSSREINKKLVDDKLNFQKYVECLEGELENACKIVEERKFIEESIVIKGGFDPDFFDLTALPENGLAHYVKCSMKGIHVSNPKPDFYDAQWIQTYGSNNPYQVALYEAIKNEKPEFTHSSIALQNSDSTTTLKIAVHLHLFYPELTNVFAEYFSELVPGYDLYITVCDDECIEDVKSAFEACGCDALKVLTVVNEGRDIAPFFNTLKSDLYSSDKYDVIGHFHSKKSADSADDVGDKWRTYLLDNLIGKRELNNALFGLFSDADLGMVFAADRHVVDFGENKKYAVEMAKAMNVEPMEFAHLFPLGSMFWARPKALSSLFEVNWDTFISPEPLPYDGSYMHAAERLLPHVVQHNGFEIKTVYRHGTKW